METGHTSAYWYSNTNVCHVSCFLPTKLEGAQYATAMQNEPQQL